MTEREEFEAYVRMNGGSIDRTDGGEYRSAPTECAWDSWQACAEKKDKQLANARKDWKAYTETVMADGSKRIKELEEQLKTARNDALEEAALECRRFEGTHRYVDDIADAIRDLKGE